MYPARRPYRITILKPTVTQDAIGNETTELVELGGAWASVDSVSGREYMLAGQTQAETTHRVIMTLPAFIVTTECVVNYGGRIFDITQCLDSPFRNELVLLCREKNAGSS